MDARTEREAAVVEEPRLPAGAREELLKLYREVDQEIRATGAVCWLRGDCCDFERSDHRLYASSLEIAFVQERYPEPFPSGSVLCPFWRERKCTERERRPLGCRTYFCDGRFRGQLEAIYEKYHRQLRELSARHGIEYRYGPFVKALRGS
jgi:Fe-S-cluster containining protein